jgi:hypothetical protein
MSAKNLFRCLVALSLVLVAMPVVLTQPPGQVPEDWQALLEWNGNGSLVEGWIENHWLLLGVGLPVVLLVLAAQLGMFFFWRFARPVNAALAAVFVLLTPFWGISVQLPVEAALWELSLLLEGAIIALSYSQPFSSYFEA